MRRGRWAAPAWLALVTTLSACGSAPSSRSSQAIATPSPTETPTATPAPTGLTVTVIAGSSGPFDPPVDGPSGLSGFSGDGGPALRAQFSYPVGMDFDRAGNLYLADNGNNRIRRISPDGIVTTVAGSGDAAGFGGDGGPATKAILSGPEDVKVDGAGNLFIADPGNNRVRKVDSKGVITTFAGTGEAATKGDGGPAVRAAVNAPDAVAIGPDGSIYVSSPGVIRRISIDGVIQTIAGNGTLVVDQPPFIDESFIGDGGPATAARFTDASAMKVDAAGNLYFADFMDCRVVKIDTKGMLQVMAGIGCSSGNGESTGDGGPATAARLARPADMELGPDGRLYVLEHFGHVRVVDKGGTISTLALAWTYEESLGMTFHGRDLYITDRDHMAVIRAHLP